MTHDNSANQPHDDAASTEGHTMAKYIAWHSRNCRCEPADTAHQNDAHTHDETKDREDEK